MWTRSPRATSRPRSPTTTTATSTSIKNNLNTCIDAVNALVADANLLSKAAVEGKLATRADATKHQGDYPQDRGGRQRDAWTRSSGR